MNKTDNNDFSGVTHYTQVDVQPGGINIQHVEHLHQADILEKLGIELEVKKKGVPKQEEDALPTKEQMCAAIAESVKLGMWWSSRSWAVVYRVYQIKGYVNGFTSFVREVSTWPVKTGFECNYDALQKPVSSGALLGNPEKWEAQGGSRQAVKLAQFLIDFLEKSS